MAQANPMVHYREKEQRTHNATYEAMIPLKLQIKNFLSYGSPTQTIDFTPHHLICLSGKNGHGKSALLDAITWAVWGQARKTTGSPKADEGLMRLGQSEMLVTFDFLCNNTHFYIRRECSLRGNKSSTVLDFGIIDPTTGKVRNLTEKTSRTTQAVIEQTVGLDFESFTTSVFLRQGNSNEFSKKSPKERKDILANMLGLAHYDLLRQQAQEKTRDIQASKLSLTNLCQHINQELGQFQEKQEQKRLLDAAYQEQLEQEKALSKHTSELAQQRTKLATQEQAYQKLLFTEELVQQNYAQACTKLTTIVQQWRSINSATRRTEQHNHEEQRKALQNELEQLETARSKQILATNRLMAAQQERQALTQNIQTEHAHKLQQSVQTCHQQNLALQTLCTEQQGLQTRLTEIAKELQQLELTMRTIHEQAHGADLLQKKLEQQTAAFERRKSFYHKFVAHGNQLAQELKQLAHKQQLDKHEQPSCPLCEQELSPTRRKLLQTKFSTQEQLFRHQLQRLTLVITNLKQQLADEHAEQEKLQKALSEVAQAVVKEKELVNTQKNLYELMRTKEHELTQLGLTIKATELELTKLQKQHKQLDLTLETLCGQHTQFQELTKQITLLETEIARYTTNQARYELVKQMLATLVSEQITAQNLVKEQALQDERKKDVHELCVHIRTLKQTLTEICKEKDGYKDLAADQERLTHAELELEKNKQTLTQAKEQLATQRGALEQICARLAQQQLTLTQEQTKLATIDAEIGQYQALAQAFGKDGIQGLLIEHLLPEIESEANALLAQLTNNQAHIMIESVRDLKSGGAKETLDIKISDALGIRPYEMFSGGEAFRIDFALRLAISKLLARRKGTALKTLIIDEGFGSQDEEGLNLIMEALYAIQDSFAKIIIVSHLPSMKDLFPVHFHITKGPRGSMIQVIEQG